MGNNTRLSQYLSSNLIVCSAITFVLTFPYFILGPASMVLVDGDEMESAISYLMTASNYEGLMPPQWLRHSVAGMDGLATGYFPLFDVIMFKLLPGWLAYELKRTGLVALGVFGVFYLSRETFGFSRLAALFSAGLLGFTLTLGTFGYTVIALTPFSLLALGRLNTQNTRLVNWVVVAGMAVLFAASVPIKFFPIYPLVFFVVWMAVIQPGVNKRLWIGTGLFFAIMYALKIPELLAYFDQAQISNRVGAIPAPSLGQTFRDSAEFVYEYIVPTELLKFVPLPQVNPSTVAFWLCVFGIVSGWRDHPMVRRILVAILILAALQILIPLLAAYLISNNPDWATYYLHPKLFRISYVLIYLGAGFGIMGLVSISKKASSGAINRHLSKIWMIPIVFMVIFGGAHYYSQSAKRWISIGSFANNYHSPALQRLAEKISKQTEPSRVAGIGLFGSVLNTYGLETAGGRHDLPNGRYRAYWQYLLKPSINANKTPLGFLFKFDHVLKLDPVTFTEKQDLMVANNFNVNLMSLANVQYVVSRDRILDPDFQLLNDELGAITPAVSWHGLSLKDKVMTTFRDNFFGKRHLFIYEYTKALPRAFFVSAKRVVDNKDQAIAETAAMGPGQYSDTVILERQWNDRAAKSFDSNRTLSFSAYLEDRIELDIGTGGTAFLVLTNAFAPDWSCTIDGRACSIQPAFGTFWGVNVPSDARRLVFQYGS